MTDRELLELAAKAAGFTRISYNADENHFAIMNEGGFWIAWHPLDNDGDALRLAVKLGIQFHLEGEAEDEMVWANEVSEITNGNALDATRRAIVRAAAYIGQSAK